MDFETAKRLYPHRFTMEHVPDWAKQKCNDAFFYAPQFRSDQEWFEHTVFPPNPMCDKNHCYSSRETWPLGKQLDAPYNKSVSLSKI